MRERGRFAASDVARSAARAADADFAGFSLPAQRSSVLCARTARSAAYDVPFRLFADYFFIFVAFAIIAG